MAYKCRNIYKNCVTWGLSYPIHTTLDIDDLPGVIMEGISSWSMLNAPGFRYVAHTSTL